MRVIESEQVGSRENLADLCDAWGIKIALEIGTDRATYACDFLRKWRGELLYCVDTWQPYPGMMWNREADFLMALHNLAPFGRRVRIIKETSSRFAIHLKDSLDVPMPSFVYIDGAHDYHSVYDDISTWWPMIPPGGILAGDDYGPTHPGVVEAVSKYFGNFPGGEHTIRLTKDYNREPSWYIHKQ